MDAGVTDFERLEGLGPDVVSRRSSEALERLLRHAYDKVPHYREILAAQGVTSSSSLHAEDLSRFPVLSRETVRNGFESGRILAAGVPRRHRVTTRTTGSTGIPLRFFGDRRSGRPRGRGWRLLDRWAGIEPGHRRVMLQVPRPRPAWSGNQPLRSLRKMIFFRQPPDLVSIYRLTSDGVPGIVELLGEKADPYSIYGTSSAIHFIATRALAAGITLPRAPRAVIGTSDTFSATQRDVASAFMGCPAYSRYGTYEVGGGVAQTCPDNPSRHHVISDVVISEVVDGDLQPVAPGDRGRLLLTDLTNFVMPFIRYEIGDMAFAAEDCGCGRPWPAIGEIVGRTADRIVLDNGEHRPAYELRAALFYYATGLSKDILEYQFVQYGPGELEMRFVPRARLKSGRVEQIQDVLSSALQGRAQVAVVPVERIDPAESGKHSLVIQKHRN